MKEIFFLSFLSSFLFFLKEIVSIRDQIAKEKEEKKNQKKCPNGQLLWTMIFMSISLLFSPFFFAFGSPFSFGSFSSFLSFF